MRFILQVLIERGYSFDVEYFQFHVRGRDLDRGLEEHLVEGPFPQTSRETEHFYFSTLSVGHGNLLVWHVRWNQVNSCR
jgi:hypothetical protein